MGPSLPPCFKVPEGTEVIALQFDKDGAKIVFLDIDGKVINVENPPVITTEAKIDLSLSSTAESMEGNSGSSIDATFNFGVKNGCDVPDAYRTEIINSF